MGIQSLCVRIFNRSASETCRRARITKSREGYAGGTPSDDERGEKGRVWCRRARGRAGRMLRVVLDGECGATSAESGGGARLFAEGCARERESSLAMRRCDEEKTRRHRRRRGWNARERKGKVVVRLAGRPGIDRLKKGWIFLPLGGGGVRRVGGRVPNANATGPSPGLSSRGKEAASPRRNFPSAPRGRIPSGSACRSRRDLNKINKQRASSHQHRRREDRGALWCGEQTSLFNY